MLFCRDGCHLQRDPEHGMVDNVYSGNPESPCRKKARKSEILCW